MQNARCLVGFPQLVASYWHVIDLHISLFQSVITTISAAAPTSSVFNYRVTADSVAMRYFFVERNVNGNGDLRLKQTIAGLSQSTFTLTVHAGPEECDVGQVKSICISSFTFQDLSNRAFMIAYLTNQTLR